MADSLWTQIDAAVRDTLRAHLPAFLAQVGERGERITYGFETTLPQGNQCPFIGIYETGGAKNWGAMGTTNHPGYGVWDYNYEVWVYVVDHTPEAAAQRGKRWIDAIRGCLERYYTLGGKVVNCDVGDLQPAAAAEVSGGVMQAAGTDLLVQVGRAGQSVAIA